MVKNLQKNNPKKNYNKQLVVYTVIFNNYDLLEPHPIKFKNVDYICFTNNKNLTSDFWKVKYLKKKNDRHIKICPHLYLKKYKISIFHDANVVLLENPIKLINKYLDNNDGIVLPRHRKRNHVSDEFNYLLKFFSFNKKQLKIIKNLLNYKTDFFTENRFIIRIHNSIKIINLMKLWWQYYQKGVFRDQLSFPAVCKIKKIKPIIINNFLNHHLIYYVKPHLNSNFKNKLQYFFLFNIMHKVLFYLFKIKNFFFINHVIKKSNNF